MHIYRFGKMNCRLGACVICLSIYIIYKSKKSFYPHCIYPTFGVQVVTYKGDICQYVPFGRFSTSSFSSDNIHNINNGSSTIFFSQPHSHPHRIFSAYDLSLHFIFLHIFFFHDYKLLSHFISVLLMRSSSL